MAQYPVGFWNYPPIADMEPEEVKVWADCGMTLTMSPSLSGSDADRDKMKKMLDECLKYGMQLIIRDPRTEFSQAANGEQAYREGFAEVYREYGHHPATYGFFLGDEPLDEAQHAACRIALRVQQEIAPEKCGFLNFSQYWPGAENVILCGKKFDVWAKDFIAQSRCQMMCFDSYNQMDAGEEGIERYFLNLHMYGEETFAASIPLWATVLGVAHFDHRIPSEDDLRWQINSAIACGCKGILFFTFYTPPRHNNYRDAPIHEMGQKTITYDHMARVNKLLHRDYGELMMRLTLRESYHIQKCYGGWPLWEDNHQWIEGTVSNQGLFPSDGRYTWRPSRAHELIFRIASCHNIPGIVSFFTDDEGKEYVMIMNNSPFESGMFTFSLAPETQSVLRVYDHGEKEIDFEKNHWDAHFRRTEHEVQAGVWLAPGQFNIFRFL